MRGRVERGLRTQEPPRGAGSRRQADVVLRAVRVADEERGMSVGYLEVRGHGRRRDVVIRGGRDGRRDRERDDESGGGDREYDPTSSVTGR